MTDPHKIDLAAHRHNEIVEALRRIALGVEALNQIGERQLRAFAAAQAALEAGLRFFVEAWQERRTPRKRT